jgi:hypothetical protein
VQSPGLRRLLEDLLADHFGRRRAIMTLTQRPCSYASSFTLDEIDVGFADGSELRLVVKDVSPEAMTESAERARPEFLYEPRREIEAYRQILPYAPHGAATWYGADVNPSAQRYRLVLERVEGLELRHVGAFTIWERAARWIAQFHRSFSPADLARLVESSRVLVYDEAFYSRWLERAQRIAARRPALRRAVDRIARGYAPVVKRLAGMPRTLIHGEFYPCNILIGRTGHRVRVCPVDWEMAALGPGLMDLACLTTGWALRAQRALVRAYRAAGPGATARSARIPHDVWVDFRCCRLHLAVRMLGWSDTWAPPPHHAHDWLAEAEYLAQRIQR